MKTIAPKAGKDGEEFLYDDAEHWLMEGEEDEDEEEERSRRVEVHEQQVDDRC